MQRRIDDALDRCPSGVVRVVMPCAGDRRWVVEAGFEELSFDAPAAAPMVGVGLARLVRAPVELVADVRLFTFEGGTGVVPRGPLPRRGR